MFLDDVIGAKISNTKMVKPDEVDAVIKLKNSPNVTVENTVFYTNEWGKSPVLLPVINNKQSGVVSLPTKAMK